MVDATQSKARAFGPQEWQRGLWLAALILLASRIGYQVPLPSVDPEMLDRLRSTPGFGGAALSRVSLFALGLTPFVSAWVVMEIFRGGRPEPLVALYRRRLTLAFAALQAWGIASALEGVRGLVPEPGFEFRLTTMLTLAASTMLLVWLGEQITRLGVCDGIWLLYAADIVAQARVTAEMAFMFDGEFRGGVPITPAEATALLALLVALVALIVLIERAWREIPIEAKDGTPRMLSFRLDRATIIPAFVASWIMMIPSVLVWLFSPSGTDVSLYAIIRSQPLVLLLYAAVFALVTYMVTAARLSPHRISAGLARQKLSISGVPPGQTAATLDRVSSRTTAITAAYLTVICLLPEVLIIFAGVPLSIGGPSLLVVVIVALDILSRTWGDTRKDATLTP